jgi:hypothetical protein
VLESEVDNDNCVVVVGGGVVLVVEDDGDKTSFSLLQLALLLLNMES